MTAVESTTAAGPVPPSLPTAPSEAGRWYWPIRAASWPWRKAWLRVEVENSRNVPDHGGVLLAANHLSFLDGPLLMYALGRRVSFLGKAEYLYSWPSNWLFPAAGMIAVDRSGRGVRRSLDLAAATLAGGDVVGIFPEGTRSRDGLLHRGHTGVARLALASGAPIVPVGIIGSGHAMPPGARMPSFGGRVRIRFGSPIDLGPWVSAEHSRATYREITDSVMGAIADLSGQPRSPETTPTEVSELAG